MNELFNLIDKTFDYRVLARKYRPSTFDELIGQEAIVKTIKNSIETGRLPQAWLLTGVRGVGKTTTARIIAKALNCTGSKEKNKPTANPCGKCETCLAIAEDRHVDVQEMDAASRTGVDDIRDVIEGVRYSPVSARYKVYILDEVHMLSKQAFNALLKTLEEPPPHVKFIFATTEVRKIPVTVLSRCQRFDLRRIESQKLIEHFSAVVVKEGGIAEPEAIKLIARAADGSVRDGLSLLDQALARGNGHIKENEVKEMLGLGDRNQNLELCRLVLRGKISAALEKYNSQIQGGSDPLQILQDLAEAIHSLTRSQAIEGYMHKTDLTETEKQFLSELSDIEIPALVRSWQILLKGIGEVLYAPNPVQAAEMVIIRIAYAADLPTPADLIRQIKAEREKQTEGYPRNPLSPKNVGKTVGSLALASEREDHPVEAKLKETQKDTSPEISLPSTFKDMVALFAEKREGTLYAHLYNSVHLVRYEPGIVELRLEPSAPTNFLSRVTQKLKEWTGKRWVVSVVDKPGDLTLAEQAQKEAEIRLAKVKEHPLMQAVFSAFPDAKIVSIRKKEVVEEGFAGDEAEAIEEADE